MMSLPILALVLAAGEGKRMQSRYPKVLQPVGGQPMLVRILHTLRGITDVTPAVIYGHRGALLQEAIRPQYPDLLWIEQAEQLGTGHAVQQAQPWFDGAATVLVLLGDVPLIERGTIEQLCARAQQTGFTLLTAKVANPHGYGRIVRDDQGHVVRIVEEKDATDAERAINEVNSGIMAFSTTVLQKYLPQLHNNNAQGEYYLTDLVELCTRDGQQVSAEVVADINEVMGVNNRMQLATAEAVLRQRQATSLMTRGATLIDPTRIDVHGTVEIGMDVVIDANVVFKGQVKLGNGVHIESCCVLEDCEIGNDTRILSHSRIEKSEIGSGVMVGPYARIRPQTKLADGSKVGNFVEIKSACIGQGSKVNHLSYIGDARIGSGVNVGAGTITCNYDGANKHQTVIEDNVFIGSNAALVAPITIGHGATVGAGSTLSRNVSAQTLTLARPDVREIVGWQRPQKIKK